MDLDSHSQTYGALTSLVIDTIVKHFNLEGQWNKRPHIVAENGDYKLDFYGPRYDADEEYITVYGDGVVQYYPDGTESYTIPETRIDPLHYRVWIDHMTRAGIDGKVAYYAVDFFRQLRKKD